MFSDISLRFALGILLLKSFWRAPGARFYCNKVAIFCHLAKFEVKLTICIRQITVFNKSTTVDVLKKVSRKNDSDIAKVYVFNEQPSHQPKAHPIQF